MSVRRNEGPFSGQGFKDAKHIANVGPWLSKRRPAPGGGGTTAKTKGGVRGYAVATADEDEDFEWYSVGYRWEGGKAHQVVMAARKWTGPYREKANIPMPAYYVPRSHARGVGTHKRGMLYAPIYTVLELPSPYGTGATEVDISRYFDYLHRRTGVDPTYPPAAGLVASVVGSVFTDSVDVIGPCWPDPDASTMVSMLVGGSMLQGSDVHKPTTYVSTGTGVVYLGTKAGVSMRWKRLALLAPARLFMFSGFGRTSSTPADAVEPDLSDLFAWSYDLGASWLRGAVTDMFQVAKRNNYSRSFFTIAPLDRRRSIIYGSFPFRIPSFPESEETGGPTDHLQWRTCLGIVDNEARTIMRTRVLDDEILGELNGYLMCRRGCIAFQGVVLFQRYTKDEVFATPTDEVGKLTPTIWKTTDGTDAVQVGVMPGKSRYLGELFALTANLLGCTVLEGTTYVLYTSEDMGATWEAGPVITDNGPESSDEDTWTPAFNNVARVRADERTANPNPGAPWLHDARLAPPEAP